RRRRATRTMRTGSRRRARNGQRASGAAATSGRRRRSRDTSIPRRRRRSRAQRRSSSSWLHRADENRSGQVELSFISIMSTDGWLGIDLRHLAALEAVARTRSFGRAARELGYTQSAVSQQIAQLERIVGQQLFHRPGGPRPVEPTEAGLLLLGHADAIVAHLDAARAAMAALAEGEAGTLRVGIYQSVGARLLPAVVRRFRAQWPRVGIRVREESAAADLLRLLEHGELDLTFA